MHNFSPTFAKYIINHVITPSLCSTAFSFETFQLIIFCFYHLIEIMKLLSGDKHPNSFFSSAAMELSYE